MREYAREKFVVIDFPCYHSEVLKGVPKSVGGEDDVGRLLSDEAERFANFTLCVNEESTVPFGDRCVWLDVQVDSRSEFLNHRAADVIRPRAGDEARAHDVHELNLFRKNNPSQVALIKDNDTFLALQLRKVITVIGVQRLGCVDEIKMQVCFLNVGPGTANAFLLDFAFRFAESRRVHQAQRNAINYIPLLNCISRCAG